MNLENRFQQLIKIETERRLKLYKSINRFYVLNQVLKIIVLPNILLFFILQILRCC